MMCINSKANNTGPAEAVQLLQFLAWLVFLEVKIKFYFCEKQVINKSDGVIFRLTRLSYNR